MILTIDIILSILLIIAGYIYTCYYFHDIKCNTLNITVLKLTAHKILYLLTVISVTVILIFLFETVYSLELLPQLKLLCLINILFPIAVIDFRTQKIPNQLLIAAIVLRLVIYAAEFIVSASNAFHVVADGLLGAFLISVFFLLLLLIFKNSIGMGDIKLFAVMGLYQGLWGAINSLFFSLMVSFILSVALLITKKKGRNDTIAFGPCMLLGSIIAIGLSGM